VTPAAAGPGSAALQRQDWLDTFLTQYRLGLMALKMLRWELEAKQ
jgi:hypothetical protein